MIETSALRDEWRKTLNRVVREFAAAASSMDAQAVDTLATAMLREIGEALDLDGCSVLDLSMDEPSGSHWNRSSIPGRPGPLETTEFKRLVQGLGLDHQPVSMSASTAPDPATDELGAELAAYLQGVRVRSAAIVPIGVGDRPAWAWICATFQREPALADSVLEHLQILGEIVSGALKHRAPAAPVPDAAPARELPSPARMASMKGAPQGVNKLFPEIIGESPSLRAALDSLDQVAHSESNVLLLGETGTGKELFARALHARSPRRAYPLVSVNCAALPPTLIESELFGHQRGAFTGAVTLRQGRFELAHRGTLFLDEIGDLPMDLQPKLLRVLQEGAFERVGSSQTHSVDVRIIAATHQNLRRAVGDGEFRADLYYRLNVFPIRLPPLRERREDIPALVWSIIKTRQHSLQRHITTVPDDVLETLKAHAWPGNIRELQNVVERALIHSTGDTLRLADGSLELTETMPVVGTTLMSVERAHIEDVLRECRWRINGVGNAAERLGLHPNTLRFRMKKLGIVRHDANPDAKHLRFTGPDSAVRHRAS